MAFFGNNSDGETQEPAIFGWYFWSFVLRAALLLQFLFMDTDPQLGDVVACFVLVIGLSMVFRLIMSRQRERAQVAEDGGRSESDHNKHEGHRARNFMIQMRFDTGRYGTVW
eukprot:CAMPEP_0204626086 /NCGR_PEP_ID=MMETSP0717-20131115/11711_1 /ASSEMBLY_ACC=CAM_ASM_000666 /TAXON_ID=230516 /ORGANISM="Chaetoceros curvisetus" /LENGTH=111 /DNA_ID=CAMNT_0051641925 /DNA_START=14 /DNA_END=350 /DNA_ORIENTATION=+